MSKKINFCVKEVKWFNLNVSCSLVYCSVAIEAVLSLSIFSITDFFVFSSQKAMAGFINALEPEINPLNTKRRLLYLKTQFVPHSKHFSSRL